MGKQGQSECCGQGRKSLHFLRVWSIEYTDCVVPDTFTIFRSLLLLQILFALLIFGECYRAELYKPLIFQSNSVLPSVL